MKKLTITRCETTKTMITPQSGVDDVFEATINPESYAHKYSTKFSGVGDDTDTAMGKPAPVPKFASAEPQNVSFSLTLDGTGVVPATVDLTVSDQIKKLRDIAYDYSGENHEPDAVQLDWGDELTGWKGLLQSLDVDYTLFDTDGVPLRATVKLDFIEAMTEAQAARLANNQSPDLTHIVQVREGDTLPLLCQRIYKDVSKYLEIARFNNLDNFRVLTPGTLLRFPPMR